MSAFEVARDVLSCLPAYSYRPDKSAASRAHAEAVLAYWMSRAAMLASALVKYEPGVLEYESWNAQFAAPLPSKEKP